MSAHFEIFYSPTDSDKGSQNSTAVQDVFCDVQIFPAVLNFRRRLFRTFRMKTGFSAHIIFL